ncbi:hypothetical protein [Nannocystis punicea]|uniref:Lipoprotein n=1 Tax=Nannocystis punicea TaxID=2995304 RepID=A0ABY7GSW3_9BACT|nr:hypothetical protein [Nannocystis poenicansa]WAS90045.1 hypothetical protein O0S08_27950 [Nannocystis poenicansa]
MRRALLLGLLAAACRDLPDVTAAGEHVLIAADPELEMCGGSMAHLDEFIARLCAEFGIEPPTGDDRPLGYWLRIEDFKARTRCAEGSACMRNGTFYAWWMPATHEVVHAVLFPYGRTLPLLAEGVAVAYQGLGAEVGEGNVSLDLDIAPLIAIRRSHDLLHTKDGYIRAGNYVAFLVERYGAAAVLQLMTLVDPMADEAELDHAFRVALGVSLEQTIEGYRSQPRYCSQLSYDAKLIECAAPELTWQGGRIAEYRALACEQEDVVGPLEGGAAAVFRTLQIDEAGWYILEFFGDAPSNRLSLRPCGGCDHEDDIALHAGEPARREWLPAGVYSVRLLGPTSARTSVGVRITPDPSQ